MAELVVEGDELVLRLSWWEKIKAAHGNVRVPLSIVTSARVEASAARYWRHPLFSIQAGGWRSLDTGYGVRGYGAGFVALRHWRRGRPAVLVFLDQPPGRLRGFQALLVTVADPEATAARITDAKDGRRGAKAKDGHGGAKAIEVQQHVDKGIYPARVQVRRLWLPWRPRLRLIWAFPLTGFYLVAGMNWFHLWVGRTFTGWLRPVMKGIFWLPEWAARMIGAVLVVEVTILVFGASIYLVAGEWLLLALMFPFMVVARLASLRPWPLVAAAGRQRWTARVGGWSASGRAAVNAVDALKSGAEPAEPPWSPGQRRSKIWR